MHEENISLSQPLVCCVLGMHRSGTSTLAGILKSCGLEFGEINLSSKHNKMGNQENRTIRVLNDAVLAENNGTWDKPADAVTWTDAHVRERTRIIEQFKELGAEQWGFKDPRTVFTLPFWRSGIPALKIIGSVRHPVLVAKSLFQRNQFPLSRGLSLWEGYNRRIHEEWQRAPFPIIRFDQPQDFYLSAVSRAIKQIGLNRENLSFFDPDLINQSNDLMDDFSIPASAQELWSKLKDIAESIN